MSPVSSVVGSLDAATVCGGLAAVLVSWYMASALWTWYRLRHIPGPPVASCSYLWIAANTLLGRNDRAYVGLKRYGSLVRNGPNYLVCDDPDVLRRISGARSRYGRDGWYTAAKFDPDQHNMATLLDTAAHDRVKAKTAQGYNGRENADLEAAVDSQVGRLVALIRRKHLSARDELRPVDLAPLSKYFTLDVITRLGYGEAFGHLDEGTDVYGWVGAIDQMLMVASICMDIPFLRRLVYSRLGLGLFGPKPTDKFGIGRMMGVAHQKIAERFEPDAKPRKDMFGSFIRNGLTQQQCEAEAILQLTAGSDTSATTVRTTLAYLMATPRAYHRLRDEIRQSIARGEASSPITYEQAQKLPYLQAVIAEGIRIRSPTTYGHYKRVPPEGDTIHGMFVPGGTAVGGNMAALMRREDVFGRDAHIFRPERFLECSDAQRLAMDRAIDISFGGGRWMCAGKTVAFMELNKLMRVFDFQLVNPERPWDQMTYFTVVHKDMWVRITEAAVR